jgi:ribonuclease III
MPGVGHLLRSLLLRSRRPVPETAADLPAELDPATLHKLERTLGYRIRCRELFVQALLHRSFPQNNSHPNPSNERLEFLGDSVLNLIVGEYLYHTYPQSPEGDLTKFRSRLVNRRALAAYANALEISQFILMSPSAAQSVGKGYETIVSDTFEALVAALYLDGGFEAARRFVEQQVNAAIRSGSVATSDENYKSRLLEYAQSHGFGVPRYTIVNQDGPDHDRTFTVEVHLRNERYGSGTGKNKKDAEQAAAGEALANIH